MSVTVRTQDDLDQALAEKAELIYVESPEGIWLRIANSGNSRVVARGSSHIEARGSSHVVSRGSSHVVAWDSAHVEAWDSSHVEAWDSSHVVARGSSHVVAWDSSHVVASDSSHVVARGSSHVEARKYAAVHLRSQHVQLSGDGHVIDLTGIDCTDPAQWCDFHGVEVTADGIATVYKAVADDWTSSRGTSYTPGSLPEAPDWNPHPACGNGLHFCAHPQLSLGYKRDAAKFVKCGVRLDEMVCLNDKIKAKRVVVACVEVDRYGREEADAHDFVTTADRRRQRDNR